LVARSQALPAEPAKIAQLKICFFKNKYEKEDIMKTINLIILVFLTTTVGLYQNTYANVFHVADGRQLSMAFSEASSNGENDIIYLAEGIYKGEFVFQTSEANSLTITSEPELKAEQVIFDGEEMVRPLYISGDVEANFLIEKISIRNGNVEDSGGGLYIKTEGKITIRSCNLTDNSATHGDGGGIYANASGDIVFIGNNISGNSSFMSTSNSETVSNGGGIYAVSTTKINFIKNTIIKNITTSSSTSTTDYYAESIAKGGGVYVLRLTLFEPKMSHFSRII
jgi:parallel beta-helix repeat protein